MGYLTLFTWMTSTHMCLSFRWERLYYQQCSLTLKINMVSLSNSLTFILANMEITLTNIGFYLIVGVNIAFILNGLATNYYQIIPNKWSISQETIYATIHSIVVNQINRTIFILVNNLIGMIPLVFQSILKNKWVRGGGTSYASPPSPQMWVRGGGTGIGRKKIPSDYTSFYHRAVVCRSSA